MLARRMSLYLKLTLATVHLVYGGVLFLFDEELIEKTKKEPWYTVLYSLLFVATLIQYFVTSISSPGYVLDAKEVVNERNGVYKKTSMTSNQPASSKNGSYILPVDVNQIGRNIAGGNPSAWLKLVTDLYPPGTATSLHDQSIVMIVTNVFFSLITIVFGLEIALARIIIVDFDEGLVAWEMQSSRFVKSIWGFQKECIHSVKEFVEMFTISAVQVKDKVVTPESEDDDSKGIKHTKNVLKVTSGSEWIVGHPRQPTLGYRKHPNGGAIPYGRDGSYE
ncbi:protein S-acyltransferase 10-like [Senna tora]|uniref:Protein S-acyltransferase 10-like n=1 Tax=Senna tora TaxID=362788 RepID=A0A834TYJ4_9FABA|nr:protein S-acyltransferase 10-like [Senna tora]